MGKISRFGLMELSRQRLRPSLSEGSHVTCPRCNGTGHIRDTESSALQVLRIIQEEAMKENSAAIHVQAPVDVAAFLLNEKRGEILKIETRHRVTVILIPNKHLETPHYKLERIKQRRSARLEEPQASYAMAEEADTDISYDKRQKEEAKPRQEAVVKGITPDQPAPIVERKPVEAAPLAAPVPVAEEGFLSRLFNLFRSKPVAPVIVPPAPAAEAKPAASRERNGRNPRNRTRGGRNGNRERAEERGAAPASEARPESTKAPHRKRPKRVRRAHRGRRGHRASHGKPVTAPASAAANGRNANARSAMKWHEAKAEQPLIAAASEAIAAPEPVTTAPEDNLAPATAAGEAQGEHEAHGDEPRRRRRRGGRNRNRRDREAGDTGETVDSNAEAAFIPVADAAMAQAEMQATEAAPEAMAGKPAPEAAAEPAAVTPPVVEAEPAVHAEPVAEPEPAAHAEPVAEAEPAVAAAAEVEPAATALSAAIAAPQVPQQVPLQTAAQIELPQQAPAGDATVAVAAAPAVAPQSTAVSAAAPAAKAAAALDDLRSVLDAAGLTLAATDPEKLRAAQEAAARIEVAPRAPRERKPLPPVATEPLVQVETHR